MLLQVELRQGMHPADVSLSKFGLNMSDDELDRCVASGRLLASHARPATASGRRADLNIGAKVTL
jgi:hypothetical protein